MAWRVCAAGPAGCVDAHDQDGAVRVRLTDGAAICVRSGPSGSWRAADPIPQPAGWGAGCVPDPEASAQLVLGPELEVGAGLVELTYYGDRPLRWRMPGHSGWKRLRRDDGGKGLLLVPATVCLLSFSNRIDVPSRNRYLIIDP